MILLGACGQKSPESIAKNVLKDSYTGFSPEHGYESSDFKGGVGTTLKFDKEKRTISNNDGESINYSVLSEEQVKAIPADFRGTLVSLESQLKGKDNFTIAVDYRNIDKPEEAEAYYQVVLTEGGKKSELLNSVVAIKKTMLSMISTEPQINLQSLNYLRLFVVRISLSL